MVNNLKVRHGAYNFASWYGSHIPEPGQFNLTAQYIMAYGQSNLAADPLHGGPLLGYGEDIAYLNSNTQAWNDQTSAWQQAVSGGAYVRANADNTGTGTGPALGLLLARFCNLHAVTRGGPVRCIATARAGQGIEHFSPASGTLAYLGEGATQHGTLNTYNWQKALWAAAGVSPQIIIHAVGEANNSDSQAAHYAKLVTLFNALHTDYPLAHILIFQTVWPADLPGAGDIVGVRAAQDQIAGERTYVHIIDASTLAASANNGVPSVLRERDYVHWSPAGYIEAAEWYHRGYQSTSQPTPTLIDADFSGAGPVTPIAAYVENRSGAGGNISAWSDVIGSASLGGVSPFNYPAQVTFDAAANNRPAVEFDRAAQETLFATLTGSGNEWFIGMALDLQYVGGATIPFMLYDSGSGTRLGLNTSFIGAWAVHYTGGSDYGFAVASATGKQRLYLRQTNAGIDLWRGVGSSPAAQVGATKVYGDGGFPAQASFTNPQIWVGSLINAGLWASLRGYKLLVEAGAVTDNQIGKIDAAWLRTIGS